MNRTESTEPGTGTEVSSEVAFANFADFANDATRRYVAPPLIMSLSLSGAVVASFLALATPFDGELGATFQPIVERFLGNGFSRTILILFLAAAVYGLLQMIGIAIDCRRLRSMGQTGNPRRRSSWLARLLARLAGRGQPAKVEWPDAIPGDLHDFADRYRLRRQHYLQRFADRYCLQRQHYVELGMLPLRFAAWALPLLGFIGTVVGVASSIGGLEVVIATGPGGQPTEGLMTVLGGLRFAFDTTLLGLLAVIPVMVLQMFLGGRESVVTEEGRRRVFTLLSEAAPGLPDN